MRVYLSIILFLLTFQHNAQSIMGKWKTIDDESGKAKSIVNIFEKDGAIYGEVVSVLNTNNKNPKCSQCKGDKKNKPVVGMNIIEGLTKNEDIFDGGTILNPSNGKIYKCQLKLESTNRLRVRGYIAFFYKTQYWIRVK